MTRILTFAPWAIYTPHIETDLELMQLAIDSGASIDLLECNADLLACDRNPMHTMDKCCYCIGKRKRGIALIDGDVRRLPLHRLTPDNVSELQAVRTQFDGIDDLKTLRVDEFDIGYAVLATMVSFFKDPDITSGDKPLWVERLVRSALVVYRSVQNHLEAESYDRAHVFNGRFAMCRAFRRACESRDVDYLVHERGSNHARYAMYENSTSHDLAGQHRRIVETWQKAADDPRREAHARQFFVDRSQGVDNRWVSHVTDQQEGLLPADWTEDVENVVIFVSSEHEFIAIGDEWKNPLYSDQLEGINRILESLAAEPGYRLWLRVHPNLRGVENEQTRAIEALKASRLRVIDADSEISTYALVRAASKVVSFGSTVGIEATYWGKPSILAGTCIYRDLGGTYNPADHDEVVRLIRSPLEPLPVTAALMYGFYWQTFGVPYRYYQARSVSTGRYRGRAMRPTFVEGVKTAICMAVPPLSRAARRRSLARVSAALSLPGADPD